MSAFSPMQPFGAPDQKQQLVGRLMEQYQEAASRASGIATADASAQPSLGNGSTVNPRLGMTGFSLPRQVALPQAHPFIPVRGGV